MHRHSSGTSEVRLRQTAKPEYSLVPFPRSIDRRADRRGSCGTWGSPAPCRGRAVLGWLRRRPTLRRDWARSAIRACSPSRLRRGFRRLELADRLQEQGTGNSARIVKRSRAAPLARQTLRDYLQARTDDCFGERKWYWGCAE